MSSRATILFKENGKPICNIYHHYDGYLEGKGYELAKFLKNIKLINGIAGDEDVLYSFANGIGCLVAQYIKQTKTNVGDMYIVPIDEREDYHYVVEYNDDTEEFIITYKDTKKLTIDEIINHCRDKNGEQRR